MKHFLLTAAPVALLTFAALPAAAENICGPAVKNQTTCTTDKNGEVKFAKEINGQTVTVNAGVTLSNVKDDAVRMRGSNNTVYNYGTIKGALPAKGTNNGSDAIDGGESLRVYNYGLIDGVNKGVDSDEFGNLYVENHGTITALNKGIDSEFGQNLRVLNYGSVSANDKAIRNQKGDNAYLLNAAGATILSERDEGFESQNNATVDNYGLIEASDDAIQVGENALINNWGTIHSVLRGAEDLADPQDGIDIDSGTINNYATGVIKSDDDAAIDFDASTTTSYINNWGTIAGAKGILVETGEHADETGAIPEANTAAQIVTNHGTISGWDGTAMNLGAGNDALYMMDGSVIVGDSLFGTGADTLSFDATFADQSFGLFDGGLDLDLDVVSFAKYAFSDLTSLTLLDDVFSLTFNDLFSLTLTNWDAFVFGNTRYSLAQVTSAALAPAPVPVPAAGLLLMGGLGAMAALRRRRKA